jgi:hypothetical protein
MRFVEKSAYGFVLRPALVIRAVLDILTELCDGCHGLLSLKERQIRDTHELQTMIRDSSRRFCISFDIHPSPYGSMVTEKDMPLYLPPSGLEI